MGGKRLSHKIRQKKGTLLGPAQKNQSKINTVGGEATSFSRESGLSSGTQKAPIAEGRGFTVRRVSLSVSLSSCLSVYHVKHMVHPNTHTFCMGEKTHPKYNLYTKKRKKKEENTGRRTKKKEKRSTYPGRAEDLSLSLSLLSFCTNGESETPGGQ